MHWNWSSRFGWEAPASFLWLTRSEKPKALEEPRDGPSADVDTECAEFGGDP